MRFSHKPTVGAVAADAAVDDDAAAAVLNVHRAPKLADEARGVLGRGVDVARDVKVPDGGGDVVHIAYIAERGNILLVFIAVGAAVVEGQRLAVTVEGAAEVVFARACPACDGDVRAELDGLAGEAVPGVVVVEAVAEHAPARGGVDGVFVIAGLLEVRGIGAKRRADGHGVGGHGELIVGDGHGFAAVRGIGQAGQHIARRRGHGQGDGVVLRGLGHSLAVYGGGHAAAGGRPGSTDGIELIQPRLAPVLANPEVRAAADEVRRRTFARQTAGEHAGVLHVHGDGVGVGQIAGDGNDAAAAQIHPILDCLGAGEAEGTVIDVHAATSAAPGESAAGHGEAAGYGHSAAFAPAGDRAAARLTAVPESQGAGDFKNTVIADSAAIDGAAVQVQDGGDVLRDCQAGVVAVRRYVSDEPDVAVAPQDGLQARPGDGHQLGLAVVVQGDGIAAVAAGEFRYVALREPAVVVAAVRFGKHAGVLHGHGDGVGVGQLAGDGDDAAAAQIHLSPDRRSAGEAEAAAAIHKHAVAVSRRGVPGDGAAGHGEAAAAIHTHAAAVSRCGVPGDGAAGHGEAGAAVHIHTAAVAVSISAGDRAGLALAAVRDGKLSAHIHLDDAAVIRSRSKIAADGMAGKVEYCGFA